MLGQGDARFCPYSIHKFFESDAVVMEKVVQHSAQNTDVADALSVVTVKLLVDCIGTSMAIDAESRGVPDRDSGGWFYQHEEGEE